MPDIEKSILTPQPGSLVAEAFAAAKGAGSHGSLEAFVAYCMMNGDLSCGRPRCLDGVVLEGPELVALTSVRRIVGVGPMTEITEDNETFYGIVERIKANVAEGGQPAPFVMEQRADGWNYLLDGNHTKMALKQLEIPRWWAITLKPVVSCEPEVAQAA